MSLPSNPCLMLTSAHYLVCKCWPNQETSTWPQLSVWLWPSWLKRWWTTDGTTWLKVIYLTVLLCCWELTFSEGFSVFLTHWPNVFYPDENNEGTEFLYYMNEGIYGPFSCKLMGNSISAPSVHKVSRQPRFNHIHTLWKRQTALHFTIGTWVTLFAEVRSEVL